METTKKGLEGVEVLETRISYIDGDNGVLEYRGHRLEDLVDLPFEAVTHLLLFGELPSDEELAEFSSRMRGERDVDEDVTSVIRTCNYNIEAMEALRTAVSYMSHCDFDVKDNSPEATVRKAMRVIPRFPTVVAAFWRIRNGQPPVQPDPALSQGANFLYMLRGERPSDLEAEIIEKDFIISAEHELNASTFSARVTASTLSDYHSAVISGLSTLIGPLHGGARMEVMEYLRGLEDPDAAEAYVMDLVARRQKVMGFGHRVYKTYDPRALVYKELARRIAAEHPEERWFEVAERVERTVLRELVEKKGKPIYPNVDFYSAVVYMYLDLDPRLATSLFAMARVAGWTAHVLEQYADNRLIRPRARAVRHPRG